MASVFLPVKAPVPPPVVAIHVNKPDSIVSIVPPDVSKPVDVPARSQYLTLEELTHYVQKYADKYRIKYQSLYQTIICEAPQLGGIFDSAGQSLEIDEAGKQEESFGVAQINLPAHPEITKEQATDPDWSIEWMAQEFAAGSASMWTCWRDLKSAGKI